MLYFLIICKLKRILSYHEHHKVSSTPTDWLLIRTTNKAGIFHTLELVPQHYRKLYDCPELCCLYRNRRRAVMYSDDFLRFKPFTYTKRMWAYLDIWY